MSEEGTNRRATLENALRRYATFDQAAGDVQRKFFRVRIWILVVGVAATTLAIVYSLLWQPSESPPITDGLSYLWLLWQPTGRPSLTDPFFYLWLAVVAMPILGSVLSAGAAKLIRGLDYVSVRGAAEAVKREVYRYRCRVGAYSPGSREPVTRDEKLASMVAKITNRLLDTDVLTTGLPAHGEDEVPGYGASDDDGLSDMTPGQYLDWRLADQRDWFKGKSGTLERRNRRFQWSIAVFGGLGTLLAAIGQEIWVPVAVAVATALTSYLALRDVEATLAGYTRAGLELDNVVTWWSGLPAATRDAAATFAALVHRTEAILGSENATWVQSMQEAIGEGTDGACPSCGRLPDGEEPVAEAR